MILSSGRGCLLCDLNEPLFLVGILLRQVWGRKKVDHQQSKHSSLVFIHKKVDVPTSSQPWVGTRVQGARSECRTFYTMFLKNAVALNPSVANKAWRASFLGFEKKVSLML